MMNLQKHFPPRRHRKRRRRRTWQPELLETRSLLAGDLVGHWLADDLNDALADQAPVESWPDAIAEIPATVWRGTPILAKGQRGGRSVVRFDAADADGIDSLRVSIADNPIDKASDFSVVVSFATDSPLLQGGTGDWFRGTGLVDADSLGLGYDWGVVLNQNAQAGAGIGNGLGNAASSIYSDAGGLNDGQLHVVVFTRQANTLSLYVDGQAPVTRSDAGSQSRSNLYIAFGQLLSGGGGYTGELADIRLYNGALSPTEVTELHDEIASYYNNQPPQAVADHYTTVEDDFALLVPAATGVLQNDSDPEGDEFTAVLIESTQHGSLTLQPSGLFVYDSDPNFFGQDQFIYVASDGQNSAPATVTIEVTPRYDPAVAIADSYKGLPGEMLVTAVDQGVLANDQNPDRVPLTAVLVENTPQGHVSLQANGALEYDPQGFTGLTTFRYRIGDGTGFSNTQTVTLVINTPPQPVDDQFTIPEDTVLLVEANRSVLQNDLDAESNPVTASLVETTRHGQLTFRSDGSFEYLPDPEYSGPDSFSYRLFDGFDDSTSTAIVRLTVEPVNDAPQGRSDLYLTFAGLPLDVTADEGVLQNDIDIDSALLTAELVTPPRSGTLTLNSSGAFRYVPAAGFSGVDDFRYRVSDGISVSNPISVGLVVATEDQQIVINEVHYDPPDNTVPAEFIELYHRGYQPVDLSDWYFSSGISYAIPAGTTLQPGQYLVIAQDPATMLQDFGVEAIGPWVGRLSSEGEDIELRDNDGRLVDLVDYRQGFPWPVAAGGDGPSMELLHPTLDNSLGGSWRSSIAPTPGAPNSVYTINAPPQIRQVTHSPQQPHSDEATTVTAKITDPNGVAQVELHYQVVLPGHFVPALLPLPLSELRRYPDNPRPENPEYSDPANWTTVAMVDDGTSGDRVAGDDIYTAVLPGQPHRTLMRYRITAIDVSGDAVTVPYPDDETRNFAYFVYDGVPDYNGHSADSLQTLPVYQLIARAEDVSQMLAYSTRDQIAQGTLARFAYNWPGAFVYNGVVYDNISMRLRGANGRYYLQGKRSMRFRFNDGHYFQAYDQDGEPYPFEWRTLTTGKMFDNRQTLTYGLNEAINMYLFNQIGVPASDALWVHFRVIDGEEEAPDQWNGDFWGLNFVLETYDIRFLDHHELEHGNLYKLINQTKDAIQQQRYQAPYAVSDGSDHDNIERNLTGSSTAEYIDAHVKLEEWYLYHALSEAIRHYDMWPDANKNMVYYFEPDYRPENSYYGKLWILPWDTDGTWGPTWNAGHDIVYNALFPASGGGADSNSTPELWPAYFNTVREIRDLLWQPDQIEPLLLQIADVIKPIEQADLERWKSGPLSAGSYSGLTGAGTRGIDALVQDMLNFAFVGGSWPGGGVGAGGRAAWLDDLQASRGEGNQLPATPTISYVGEANFPADGLRFRTSSFSDPQGNQTFAQMEWRIAEITDPSAPGDDPAEKLKLEWNARWESGELSTFTREISPPIAAVEAGHTYRARVRVQDNTGRWSHWSEALQFTATAALSSPLVDALRITEIHYHPADPTTAEIAAGFNDADDFEFLELANVSSQPIDLSGAQLVRLDVNGQSEGVDFDFARSPIRQLLPGDRILVVENLDAFQMRYGTDLPVAGQWQGGLDNNSEQLTLQGDGFLIQQFRYDDDWYRVTDGGGPSLELARPYPTDVSLWGQSSSWRASVLPGGTPGTGTETRIPGDSNGDGRFDSSDFVVVFQAGEYEDNIPNNSTFDEGDWNGDGDFDSNDMVFAFQAGYYELNAVPAVSVWSRRSTRESTSDDATIRDEVFALLAADDDTEFAS